jgi:hypothetical protein
MEAKRRPDVGLVVNGGWRSKVCIHYGHNDPSMMDLSPSLMGVYIYGFKPINDA